MVPDVEPEIFPLDSLPRGVLEKIFIFFPGPHNFLGTTYLGDSIGTGVGVETEEVIEEMKMRLDTEWGGQMMKLDPLMEKKTPQEIAN